MPSPEQYDLIHRLTEEFEACGVVEREDGSVRLAVGHFVDEDDFVEEGSMVVDEDGRESDHAGALFRAHVYRECDFNNPQAACCVCGRSATGLSGDRCPGGGRV